ncbi:MAG: CYTH domain-containing protein [Candidatus Melainabacteria bacterium]|nr:CYTH domain-containing protein [Candidatus Melainabacteria bacterium]
MGVFIKLFQFLLWPWLNRKFKDFSAASAKDNSQPHFEVERKYGLSKEEFDGMPGRLRALGLSKKSDATILDTFIPAEIDGDMIRVRDETSNAITVTVITLKEWVDVDGSRERKERESGPIDTISRETFLALGRRLAGTELMSFSKERATFSGYRDKRKVTVALDLVSGLGTYSGTYLEIELIVERQEDVAEARAFVEKFAVELIGSEREFAMSYMEMLKRSRQEQKKN